MISSASPSLKYSCSLSPLMLAKGRTAIDGCLCARLTPGLLPSRLQLRHALKPVRGPLGETLSDNLPQRGRGLQRRRIVAQHAAQRLAAESPANARVPEIISYSTAPKLNMSDRSSSAFPSACSGDM